ncbi:MAG: substrate-binding domain-containing protein [Pseudomonadota bacterium]
MVVRRTLRAAAFSLLAAGLVSSPTPAQDRFIVVASTTSTEQSGLLARLLPLFRARTGIAVRVVAQGTGQALNTAARGDADVVLVHDRAAEDKFLADGFGIERRDVMFNDFVILGPRADPARIAGASAPEALRRIAATGAPFASRGDDSGTHRHELRLWAAAGLDPRRARPTWYRETGAGMGPTLNIAAAIDAYALADRGTWIAFRNRGELSILVAGDPTLANEYGIILVNPARHPHVKRELGMAFIDWMTSPEGQQAIADYKIDGEQMFFPNSRRAGP